MFRGDVVVPYTHNAVAHPLQLLLPLAISGDLVGLAVRAAIDFDNQACLAAEEICEVWANGHLAEEFDSRRACRLRRWAESFASEDTFAALRTRARFVSRAEVHAWD